MSQRHPLQNQALMFVTTNVRDREPVFADNACARIAVETLYSIQEFYPFFLYSFVIMPDHCHLFLLVPEHGSVSKVIGIYKRAVTFNLGRSSLWQPRYYMTIPKHAESVISYIENNPVKAGLCNTPKEYPWSSASGRWDVERL